MDVVQIINPVLPESIVVMELDPLYSREAGQMAAGQLAQQFQVLGQQTLNAPAAEAQYAGNTGNGVITLDPAAPLQAGAQPGAYMVRFTGPYSFGVYDPGGRFVAEGVIAGGEAVSAAKAGMVGNGLLTLDPQEPVLGGASEGVYKAVFTSAEAFNVNAPGGALVGAGVLGEVFADQIQFQIDPGATAFAVGDEFDITVSALPTAAFNAEVKFTITPGTVAFVANDAFEIDVPGGQTNLVPLNPAANDGSQNAFCVACYASDSDGGLAYWARGPVVLRQDMLVWPQNITGPQLAAAIAQLSARGIVSRATG